MAGTETELDSRLRMTTSFVSMSILCVASTLQFTGIVVVVVEDG